MKESITQGNPERDKQSNRDRITLAGNNYHMGLESDSSLISPLRAAVNYSSHA